MLTKNQRRFRKEMKKVQQTAERRKVDPFYSYVEDEVITDYYSQASNKKTSRKMTTTLWIILSILIIIGIYRFFIPFVTDYKGEQTAQQVGTMKQTENKPQMFQTIESKKNTKQYKEQEKLFQYLGSYKLFIAEVYEYINYGATQFPQTQERNPTYEADVSQYIKRIRSIVGEIGVEEIPESAGKLKDLHIELLSISHEQLTYLLSSVENNNPTLVDHFNILNEESQLIQVKIKSEMILALSSVGMKYRVLEDGRIEYSMTTYQ